MTPTSPFANLFGQQPFVHLQNHMRVVLACAREVTPLLEALIAGDQEGVVAIKDEIFKLEEEADKIKNKLRAHLPKSLFMPVDRRDLLEVLQMQDSIADVTQDVAGLLIERQMTVPPYMQEPLLALTRRCVDVAEQCGKVIEELDELLAIGFRGREATKVEDMVGELNKIEDETDELGITLTRILFEHEDEMKPVSVIFWYQLIQWIGDIADYSEKVGDRLRLLIAR